jgi:hypothetical protein
MGQHTPMDQQVKGALIIAGAIIITMVMWIFFYKGTISPAL